MATLDRKRLLDILDSKLSAEEVATLVFDLGLDQANLEGAIKRDRAELYRNKGDYDQAIADYTQAIKLRPDYGSAYRALGLSYDVIGNQARALDNYTKAVELAPDEWVYLGRGSIYVKQGDLDRALSDFTEAIRLRPNVIQGYYDRGLVYQQRNEQAKAIADFEKVLELSPDATWQKLAEEQLKALKAR